MDDALRAALQASSTNSTNEKLRIIMDNPEYGLGVAILVAWKHGLKVRHIPVSLDQENDANGQAQVRKIEPSGGCPYTFVHVPVRQIRRNTDKLVERGILNPNADPGMFVYHEDGLIGTFSFKNPESASLTEDDVAEILRALEQQGILVPANIENRQIQFKDLAVKRRIEASHRKVYVRTNHKPLDRKTIRLPAGYNSKDVWEYVVESLEFRFACNYCSVQALSPKEATLNSAHASTQSWYKDEMATVRNYQLGFTFSPVGDPKEVCHFLAWDFPHISDLVMNMEPQAYSFSDLIRLVQSINHDTERFYQKNYIQNAPAPITGACNHWAGNSIYHQHYQFFSITGLPMLRAIENSELLVKYLDTEVRRLGDGWRAPAFIIRSLPGGTDEGLMRVADKVAREWRVLAEGEDYSYGNEIVISNHTQNILVTFVDDELVAIFVPRLRLRVSTSDPHNEVQKKNAGVLEMMGYLVIDDPQDFDKISQMPVAERKDLGDSWLAELAPDTAKVAEFEENVRICLSATVDSYEQRVDELSSNRPGDWRTKARDLVVNIQRDGQLDPKQREHLYRELVWALLEPAGEGNDHYAGELPAVAGSGS
ncbi:MAG TPA: hypothetical protein VKU77_02060 [Streptosporangiaceae bacterium]|nr:hypothetical protein [Streptosporangiaceae bacterium]